MGRIHRLKPNPPRNGGDVYTNAFSAPCVSRAGVAWRAAGVPVMVVSLWGVLLPHPAAAQEDAPAQPQLDLNTQYGPLQANLGTRAQIDVPGGYMFLDGNDTRTLMEQMGNPASGTEVGTIAPENDDWFLVFEFDEIGYVKDDEKDQLDPDAILASIKEGNKAGNQIRAERGMPPMHIVGWEQPPKYNPDTNNLEWCVRGTSEGHDILNHNTRILGRRGVMQVTLVVDPDHFDRVMPEASSVMQSFAYVDGEKYSQWQAGDKIAKYGLLALVTGGAAAVALKTGLLQKLIKPIIAGLVVVGAFAAKMFKRFAYGRSDEAESPA